MKTNKLNELEQQLRHAGAENTPVKQILIVNQDKKYPDLFHGDDASYTRAQLEELKDTRYLIMAMYPGHANEDE